MTPPVHVQPRTPGLAWRRTAALLGCIASLALLLAVPPSAGAYATAGAGPAAGAPGLPDGRVYEQVSPANKFGNAAGGFNFGAFPFMTVTEDGNSALYSTSGIVGESQTGFGLWFVAKRSPGIWKSSSITPRPFGGQGFFDLVFLRGMGLSSDLKKTLFMSYAPYVKALAGAELGVSKPLPSLYLAGANGQPPWMGEPLWLGEPQLANPEEWGGGTATIAGASTDLSTVYFAWGGTLVPGDNEADPSVEDATRSSKQGMGFYEWRNGSLAYAGVLPDGSIDPYGAEQAIGLGCMNGDATRNQVSRDGAHAFFISPAPRFGVPASDPTELYVRETAPDGSHRTVLVSRDTLLPSVNGLPADAPHAPVEVIYPTEPGSACGSIGAFMYASPDGSHVFFESKDQLTSTAPNDTSIKEYEFDLGTETLTYLPGVTMGTEQATSPIISSTADGSRFVFEKNNNDADEAVELDMWVDGPNGASDGQIVPIVQFPASSTPEVGPVRIAKDGTVVLFETNAELAGFNTGGVDQVYRYDLGANEVTCVSCPPAGVTPTGPAYMTHDVASPSGPGDEWNLNFNRAITEDGSRIYFDSPDALVPQDVNGHRDAYEWENGSLYLLSTGSSRSDSFIGDNTSSGGDAVFSTAQGLNPNDVDEGYDVYDARIPRPGDNPPPEALPCQGDVCQGPPSVPSLLGIPASAAFNGLGNPSPATESSTHRKGKLKHKPKRRKRHRRHHKRGKAHKSTSKTKGNG